MLGAVVLSVAPSVSTETPVALALLPLLAGVAIATQQGLNGRVAAAAGGDPEDPDGRDGSVLTAVLPAATVNFVVGLAALVVAGLVAVAVLGPPQSLPSTWYLYLGGPLGAVFIGLSAWIVGQIGVLLLALGAVAGQVVASLVIDVVLPSAAGAPSVTTVLGAALTLVAAGVVAAPWRSRRSAARRPVDR